MKHPTIREQDFDEVFGEIEICTRCGTQMENVNKRTIVPTQNQNSIIFVPRWYCPTCKTQVVKPRRDVVKPSCVL